MGTKSNQVKITNPLNQYIEEHLQGQLFFSVNDFAKIVGMHRNSIDKSIRDGTIPTLIVGKSYRVPISVIYEMLATREGGAEEG